VAHHVTAADVERLAAIADVVISDEDREPVAEALEAHLQFVEPLLRRDLSAVPPAVRFDPEAHWSTSTR
jgi:Asp-tRNA(Asn)/Glu-tRNA(Gln) amidotransferase C subunit